VELQEAQGDRKAEVFHVSNNDTAVAQRRLEDKQPEEKTNTDFLVKEQEKEYQTGWKIKTGNILVSFNQREEWGRQTFGCCRTQQQNGSTYLVNMSPSSTIRFKKPIDMLGFFCWLASIKQGILEPVKFKCISLGYHKSIVVNKLWRLDDVTLKVVLYRNIGFNESGEYKKTFIGSGVGTGSVQVLYGFEFEVEPQENVDKGAGLQEVQTQDLIDYQLARDNKQHLACKLFRYKEDNNEDAFEVAAVEKIYAHESLTFNNIVICEDEIWAIKSLLVKAKGNILNLEIIRDQGGNTLRVSQSRIHNEKLVQTFLKGHSILSLEDSLSMNCDVKNASAGVDMLDGFDRALQINVQGHSTLSLEDSLSIDRDVKKNDKRSITGYGLMILGCAGSLKANLQHMKALLTTKARYVTFIEAWKKETWLKGLLTKSRHELSLVAGWMSFSKRQGKNTPQCYTKPLNSLKNWNNRFFWVDERVFPTVVDWQKNASKDGMSVNGTYSVEAVRALDTHQMDLFSLIHAPNPTKVKTRSRLRAPHELSLLALTAFRVIEMDEPARSLRWIFANEDGASDQGTAALEMPSPVDVPAIAAPRVGQAEEAVAAEPPVAQESRKRGHDGVDANAPPNDPDPLSFTDAPSRHPIDVAQSSPSVVAAEDPESENASSPTEVESPRSVYRPEWGVTNGNLLDTPEACQDLVDHVAPPGYFSELRHMRNEDFLDNIMVVEDKSARLIKELEDMRARFSDLQVSHGQLSQQVALLKEQVSEEEKMKAAFEQFKQYEDERVERRCTELDARLDALSIDFDEELYPHMLTAIAGRRWVAQLTVESIEAYDPEAKAKFVAALQSLKDLKYPLLDQLEGLKDAPMDVIMAALYLESDTGGDAPQYIRDLRPSSSQLTIPVYPEVGRCSGGSSGSCPFAGGCGYAD
nr:zinc finger, CCHC-type [Tanacetum cinerariifolium]